MRLISLLSGIVAVLGAYLYLYGGGMTGWIGAVVFIAGIVALAQCIRVTRQQEKNIYKLHGQLMDFLEGRVKTPRFSVNDDMFALLENSVVELENRLLLEQDNAQKESKKNADFITDVSHQLKTPLAALKLYCEMDNESNPGPYSQKQLVLIERMEHLIYSLLRLEKLRAAAYEMQFAAHDFSTLTQHVWEELEPLYPKKAFCLTGKAAMRYDAYWMGEALKNILINSCEHTGQNGRISVALERGDTSVTVTIEDNGAGVPEEELPKLFQRFYRSSRLASRGGAGIGLAITKTIVERHHGTIYAENTGQGLRIVLCFPLLDGVMRG